MVQTPQADAARIGADLEHLCVRIGPRPGGLEAEARARKWLAGEFRRIGLASIRTETFEFDNSAYSSCAGEWFAAGRGGKLDVRPCSYSLSTPEGGLEGKLVFLGAAARMHQPDGHLAGKIGLLLGVPMPDPAFLDSLCSCGLAGAILVDHRTWSSWPVTLNFPESWASRVRLPLLSLPYAQAWPLARKRPVRVRLAADCTRFRSTSGNVIAELPGRSRETIILCAHLDSVVGSEGANDDASGIALILEVARLLSGSQLRRTVRFIGMGMEERLSVGAHHYASSNRLDDIVLCVNFDSCGSLLGTDELHVAGRRELLWLVRNAASRCGFVADVTTTITPYSDHFPFNMAGIPSVWHYRPTNTAGDWFFHSANDRLANLSPLAIARAASFAAALVQDLAACKSLPFRVALPQSAMHRVRQYARWMYGASV